MEENFLMIQQMEKENIYHDGIIYGGDWKNDKQHGKGKEQWPDDTIYEGDYLNGQKMEKVN